MSQECSPSCPCLCGAGVFQACSSRAGLLTPCGQVHTWKRLHWLMWSRRKCRSPTVLWDSAEKTALQRGPVLSGGH